MEQKEVQPTVISFDEKAQTQPIIISPARRETNATSYLTQENIRGLMRIFNTEEAYKYYMRCLWILRDLASKSCEINTPEGWTIDINSKSFPIYKTTNDFISCLLQDEWRFDSSGNCYKM